MSLHRVRAIAVRIARQFRRDRRSLALLLVVPIVMLTLLAWIFNTGSRTVEVIVTGENPAVQSALVDALNSAGRIHASGGDREGALAELRDREIDALIEVPPGFTPAPATGQQLHITVEGSDPQRSASTVGALSRALPRAILQIAGLDGDPVSVDVKYLHGGPQYDRLDSFAPVYIAFFTFFFVYLLTSISFLRERTQGSLERLLVSPLRRSEIVVGYMLGFSIFAAIQSTVVICYVVYVLDIHYEGRLAWVFLMTMLLTIGAVNLGITLSAFARTELQVVQFIPIAILPQVLLSGVIFPVADLPRALQLVARFLPLTWACDALRGVMLRNEGLADLWLEVSVLALFALVMVLLGSLTLRRDTP